MSDVVLNYIGAVIVCAASILIGYAGYVTAHSEVARECDRLGAFYVGDVTYVCKRKES